MPAWVSERKRFETDPCWDGLDDGPRKDHNFFTHNTFSKRKLRS